MKKNFGVVFIIILFFLIGGGVLSFWYYQKGSAKDIVLSPLGGEGKLPVGMGRELTAGLPVKSTMITSEDPVVNVRTSTGGETWVESNLGQYEIHVVFPSYEKYTELVLEKDGFNLDMDKMVGAIARTEVGVVSLEHPLVSVLEEPVGTVCGLNHVARAYLQMEDGTWIGVGFSGDFLSSPEHDVNDDCDVFAWGGCGGPDCINVAGCSGSNCEEGGIACFKQKCISIVLPFLPDLCACGGPHGQRVPCPLIGHDRQTITEREEAEA